jgi:DNA repair protein RecO (recombination protein O)
MESIGKYLRKQRESRAMSVEEVSRATRIPVTSIDRLENDHFDDLPGEVFVRGFLKAYARAVALPVEDVLARYTSSRRVAYVTPIPVMSPLHKASKNRFGVAIAFVVLLVLFTLALSIVLKPRGRDLPQEISEANPAQVLDISIGLRRVAARPRAPRGIELRGRALVLRAVPFGEADVVVTLLTDVAGKVSALARGARRAGKTSRLFVDAMHTLAVTVEERPTSELGALKESRLEKPRSRLLTRLDALEQAGRVLRWIRDAVPPRVPEPELFAEVERLLDAFDARRMVGPPVVEVATMGIRMLEMLGWGFDLDRCIRCGKPCPPGTSGLLDPAAGGLVCRSCGGAAHLVRAPLLAAMRAVSAGVSEPSMGEEDAPRVIAWVDAALQAHSGARPR